MSFLTLVFISNSSLRNLLEIKHFSKIRSLSYKHFLKVQIFENQSYESHENTLWKQSPEIQFLIWGISHNKEQFDLINKVIKPDV